MGVLSEGTASDGATRKGAVSEGALAKDESELSVAQVKLTSTQKETVHVEVSWKIQDFAAKMRSQESVSFVKDLDIERFVDSRLGLDSSLLHAVLHPRLSLLCTFQPITLAMNANVGSGVCKSLDEEVIVVLETFVFHEAGKKKKIVKEKIDLEFLLYQNSGHSTVWAAKDALTVGVGASFSFGGVEEWALMESGAFRTDAANFDLRTKKNNRIECMNILSNVLSAFPTDVVMRVVSAGGKKVSAHKAVLAAHSRVIADMTKANPKFSEFEIEDVSFGAVKEFKIFCYTGETPNLAATPSTTSSSSLAEELLLFCDSYDVETLARCCDGFMAKALTPELAVRTLLLADCHNRRELRSRCFDFIERNHHRVFETEAWKKLKEYSRELFDEVVDKVENSPLAAKATGLNDNEEERGGRKEEERKEKGERRREMEVLMEEVEDDEDEAEEYITDDDFTSAAAAEANLDLPHPSYGRFDQMGSQPQMQSQMGFSQFPNYGMQDFQQQQQYPPLTPQQQMMMMQHAQMPPHHQMMPSPQMMNGSMGIPNVPPNSMSGMPSMPMPPMHMPDYNNPMQSSMHFQQQPHQNPRMPQQQYMPQQPNYPPQRLQQPIVQQPMAQQMPQQPNVQQYMPNNFHSPNAMSPGMPAGMSGSMTGSMNGSLPGVMPGNMPPGNVPFPGMQPSNPPLGNGQSSFTSAELNKLLASLPPIPDLDGNNLSGNNDAAGLDAIAKIMAEHEKFMKSLSEPEKQPSQREQSEREPEKERSKLRERAGATKEGAPAAEAETATEKVVAAAAEEVDKMAAEVVVAEAVEVEKVAAAEEEVATAEKETAKETAKATAKVPVADDAVEESKNEAKSSKNIDKENGENLKITKSDDGGQSTELKDGQSEQISTAVDYVATEKNEEKLEATRMEIAKERAEDEEGERIERTGKSVDAESEPEELVSFSDSPASGDENDTECSKNSVEEEEEKVKEGEDEREEEDEESNWILAKFGKEE